MCMRTLKAAIVVGLLALLGCGASQPPPPPAEPEVLMTSGELKELTYERATLSFAWQVQNPTADPASVVDVKWEITVGDQKVAGESKDVVAVPAGGSGDGAILADVDLPHDAATVAARSESAVLDYALTGALKLKRGKDTDVYELADQGDFVAPRPVRFFVEPEAARYEGALNLTWNFSVYNPNPFVVSVDTIDFKLTVGEGLLLSESSMGAGEEIQPNATLVYPFPIKVAEDVQGAAARPLVRSNGFPYHIEGTVSVAGIALPANTDGEITFSQ